MYCWKKREYGSGKKEKKKKKPMNVLIEDYIESLFLRQLLAKAQVHLVAQVLGTTLLQALFQVQFQSKSSKKG